MEDYIGLLVAAYVYVIKVDAASGLISRTAVRPADGRRYSVLVIAEDLGRPRALYSTAWLTVYFRHPSTHSHRPPVEKTWNDSAIAAGTSDASHLRPTSLSSPRDWTTRLRRYSPAILAIFILSVRDLG